MVTKMMKNRRHTSSEERSGRTKRTSQEPSHTVEKKYIHVI